MTDYPNVSLRGITETIFVNPREIIYALADRQLYHHSFNK